MEWMKTKIARKQATNILKMIDYLQANEITEYEQFVQNSDRYKEKDDEPHDDQIVITTERQHRFEPTGQARTSIRQQSHQHLFHKQETPFFEPDQPVGAVKVQQFAPKQRIGLSHSPEFLPLTSKREETKEKPKEISIVKVDQTKVEQGQYSPTVKDFAVKSAVR